MKSKLNIVDCINKREAKTKRYPAKSNNLWKLYVSKQVGGPQ